MKMNIQKFAGKATNVFPVSDNKFKVGAAKESATTVADRVYDPAGMTTQQRI